ncbi:MAG TPA: alpha/beta fold hydrolase [Burkholderiales bacterium]|nr:alpha/beta fold hydrolase [Burkholderiales bacterium]
MKRWLALLAALPIAAAAQSWGPRSLDELKQETVRRAERNIVPLTGIKAEDAREVMAGLQSLEPDDWAAAWSRIGERYFAAGDYFHAWDIFNVARWPSERLSPGKQKAYARALEAFQRYGQSLNPPIETLRIPFEGKEIVAYLRIPRASGPVALVFGINGLDSRKEEVIARADGYLNAGVGVLAIDMPGTGQAPILIDLGAERMFSAALDYLATRHDVDAKRIVVQGRSWSGYWAAVLAYTEKDRIRGAVVHGVGIHEYFAPEWQKKAFSTREYLFDIYPARAAVYGTKTMEAFLAYGPRLSLVARGLIDKPSAPMLLVNGERDTQQPIADLYLLMKHGEPKEVWVNPAGGHMGRSERWPQAKVLTDVVEPWVLHRLGVARTVLAQAKDEKDTAKPPATPAKPGPRLTLKPKGGTGSNVGDDAPGGGPRTAEPAKGGTPGTPSGSFTGVPPKP